MSWKLDRVDWHKYGNCWTWWKISKSNYYSGKQVHFTWGRLSFVFVKKGKKG